MQHALWFPDYVKGVGESKDSRHGMEGNAVDGDGLCGTFTAQRLCHCGLGITFISLPQFAIEFRSFYGQPIFYDLTTCFSDNEDIRKGT